MTEAVLLMFILSRPCTALYKFGALRGTDKSEDKFQGSWTADPWALGEEVYVYVSKRLIHYLVS